MASRRLVALSVAMLLALPGTAFAQSAGDDQYEDPFGSGQPQEQPAEPQSTPEPAAPAAPAEPGPAAPAETETQPAAPAAEATPAPAAAASQEQLPNTGLETGLVAAAGALLVGAGVTLRVRSRTR